MIPDRRPPRDGHDVGASGDDDLARALEVYLEAVEAGRPVDIDLLEAEYPAAAEEIRSCIGILRLAGQVEGPPRVAAAPEPMDEGPPAPVLGDFRILRQVGRGGMGVVYEAEQISLRRRVALKVLPFAAALDPRQLRRFETEAQAAAQLHHSHIVPVFSVGCERGVHYYAMQYIEGQTLAALIPDPLPGPTTGAAPIAEPLAPVIVAGSRVLLSGRGAGDPGPWGPEVASGGRRETGAGMPGERTASTESLGGRSYPSWVAALGVQAAEALEHAHSFGIVHRDIKPANLLVDTRGHLWITDFGLARIQSGTALTMTGDVIGTLRYMSPEQAMSRRAIVDHRSDIYSLGVTLYELLASRPAFGGRDRQELLRQITMEEPRPLRAIKPSIPVDLETIVLKAMAKEAVDRYPTSRELAEDLRRFLDLKPIRARRPTLWDRGLKLARRHTTVVATALIVLILAVGGLATGLILLRRERDLVASKEKEARASAREAQERAIDLNRQLYINRVNRAFGEWRENNVALAVSLLEDCPVGQRGWEWSYCWRLCHLDSLTLRGNGRPFRGLAFSPDGRWLITAARAQTRDEIGPGEWTIWDSEDGQALASIPTPGIQVVAVEPSGSMIAVGSVEGEGPGARGCVALWPVARDGSPRAGGGPVRVLRPRRPIPRGLAFSPDGRWLAVASFAPGTILEFWEVATGRLLGAGQVEDGRVSALAFRPDGRQVATACSDGSVRLWAAPTAAASGRLRGHSATVYDVDYSQDGRRIVSGSLDETVRVWDSASMASLHVLRGHGSFVRAVAFDSSGERIASASEDNAIRIWDAAAGKEIGVVRGHAAFVTDVAFRPDGRRLASASEDGTVKLWDTAAAQAARVLPHPAWVWHAVFLPDGTKVATLDWDGVIRLWDAATSKPIRVLQPRASSAMALGDDGRRLAAIADERIHLWEVETGRPLLCLGRDIGPSVGLAFRRDGRQFASTGPDDTVRLWDGESGRLVHRMRGPWGTGFAAAYSPDGTRIACAFTDGTIRIWDADDGHEIRRLASESIEALSRIAANSLAYSPDGRWLAACSNSIDRSPGEVRVFNTADGRRIFTLRGHTSNVVSVEFSPDGRRLATASFDRTVKLWETETGQEIFTLRGHTSGVLSVAFSGDGRRLITGSIDSTARIWETASSEADLP